LTEGERGKEEHQCFLLREMGVTRLNTLAVSRRPLKSARPRADNPDTVCAG